jgi:glycosyltransferase involved in cell wall biosynthesis
MTAPLSLSSKPLVSVVIPTLNRPAFLREAVAAALSQTYDHRELVIVDDGSDPEAIESLRGIFDLEGIRFLRNPRRLGVSAARNIGVHAARGELIAFLDDDDLWLPGYLETGVKAFLADPELGMVRSQLRALDLRTGSSRPIFHLPPGINSLNELFEYGCATPSGIMVRKECLTEIGGFDESLSRNEDLDLCLRLAERFRCFTTRAELAIQRSHEGSISTETYRFRAAFVSFYVRMLARPPRGVAAARIRSKIVFFHQILLCHLMSDGDSTKAPRHITAALRFWLANPGVWREAPKLPKLCFRATISCLVSALRARVGSPPGRGLR